MGTLRLDVEVLSDREEELLALFAALAQDDEVPPIIQDEVPEFDWEEAA